MKNLFSASRTKIERIPLEFQRFLLEKINWNHQLIAIKGARGSGKTTLILQYIKRYWPKDESVLYVTLDEVHKYPNWSK